MPPSDSSNQHRPVALDLVALTAGAAGQELDHVAWPTPYSDYAFLSRDLIDAIVGAGRAMATTPELEATIEAKLYDTITDVALIARLAVDLQHLRAAAAQPLYDAEHSRWLRFLDDGETDASKVLGKRAWHHHKAPGVLPETKRRVRRWHADVLAAILPVAGRHDVLSRNTLLDEYFARSDLRQIDVSPNHRDWLVPSSTPAQLRDVVNALADAFAETMALKGIDDARLAVSARALAHAVIDRHLSQAASDLSRIRQIGAGRRAGGLLSGGTPKHIGRLFAWQYKQSGRDVVRFAHGGDRAFFDDYPWSLAELPFCDRYYCHGRGEAARIAERRVDGRMVRAGPDDMEFISLGSRKHQILREQAARTRPGPRNGTVMYVAGGYLGERLGDFPSRKPPDVLYFEWQTWLLKALRAAGFRTVVKVHPKGVLQEAMLLQPYCDEIVAGHFDPLGYDVDCYVFDFAGAAFFDALASNRGVVLVEMGVRPQDPNSFDDLRARCEVVPCSQDERMRFRADTGALAEAIEKASTADTWPDSFFETYFQA